MKIKLMSLNGSSKGNVEVPETFLAPFRPDLIKKAFKVFMTWTRQAYGSDPKAGMKSSAKLSRRRRAYRGSYGFGISRVPRKILMRRGRRMYWVGAWAAGTVGGREPHHPKAEKIWTRSINKKEYDLALRSAIAAGINKDVVEIRGHKVPDSFPFAVEAKFDEVATTKDLVASLEKMGFSEELARAKVKKIRSGVGKRRGRPYKKKKSVLLVTGNEDSKLFYSATNVPGIEVRFIEDLTIEDLAPGNLAGRPVLFVESAFK